MKKFIFSILMVVCSSAFSMQMTTPDYVCKRTSTWNADADCHNVVRRATYFDKRALHVCDRYRSNQGTINCLAIVRDRVYNENELVECDRELNEVNSNNCLNARGVYLNHLNSEQRHILRTRPYAWFSNGGIVID